MLRKIFEEEKSSKKRAGSLAYCKEILNSKNEKKSTVIKIIGNRYILLKFISFAWYLKEYPVFPMVL